MQISMNVSTTLMAVITTASIPLGPLYAVVGLDMGWPPISGLVKVGMEGILKHTVTMHAKMNVDLILKIKKQQLMVIAMCSTE